MKVMYNLAAVVAFLCIPASAIAATVKFEFKSDKLGGLYGAQGTEWVTPDGFITATSTGGDLFIGSNSLGVAKPGQRTALYQQLNNEESLRFTFAAPVTGVTLTRSGGIFPVDLTSYNGTGVVFDKVFTGPGPIPPSMPVSTVLNGPDNLPITSFLLQGIWGTGAGIASITYTTVDVPPPSPVPLPAAGMLLLGGLAAMAGLRRRGSRHDQS